ncbi:PIN domain-containing protein [Conexibacter arvalis]|uniref:Ribonuclease VapC n=1 Tax=Conexibacter arvalis TaxID=912552 RepID=A0A840I9A2_9ACTN|nr:hypothetical protein [Conexibacter arvalis]
MTLYLDTSALVKLLVAEDGSGVVRSAAGAAGELAASHIAYVETHSALARMRAGDRLTRRVHAAQAEAFRRLWSDVAVVPVTDDVVERAARLAERHLLRGYDALQLSSALELRDASDVRFASWDDRLNVAAARERLTLLPLD